MPFLMSEKSVFQLELNWFNRKSKEFVQYTYTDIPILWKSENLLVSFLNYLLIWLCQVLLARHGIEFPDQGLNMGLLHWECGVLATRLPGKSLGGSFNIKEVHDHSCFHWSTEEKMQKHLVAGSGDPGCSGAARSVGLDSCLWPWGRHGIFSTEQRQSFPNCLI